MVACSNQGGIVSIQAPSAPAASHFTAHDATELVSALEELSRALKETAMRMARDLEWPRAGIGVLRLLQACGPVQLTDVASRLRVDVSVASRQVSALVDAGLVRRTVDDVDRRARTLELTPEGKVLADEATEHVTALVRRQFEGWTPEELEQTTFHIRRVAAAIAHEPTKESTAR
jgi:DNA-binding MarR family transcriptional regulator